MEDYSLEIIRFYQLTVINIYPDCIIGTNLKQIWNKSSDKFLAKSDNAVNYFLSKGIFFHLICKPIFLHYIEQYPV